MANEITITTKFRVSKDLVKIDKGSIDRFDMAGTNYVCQTMDLTTVYEVLPIPVEIGIPGYAYFKNVGDTYSIEIGLVTASMFLKFSTLGPGMTALLPLSDTNYYVRAADDSEYAETSKLDFAIIEL